MYGWIRLDKRLRKYSSLKQAGSDLQCSIHAWLVLSCSCGVLLHCWFPGVCFACTAGNERVNKKIAWEVFGKKPGDRQVAKKWKNKKSQTRQKNKTGGREGESNDSPEIPDRGVRHQTSLASLLGGTKFCTPSFQFHLTHFTPGMDTVLSKSAVYT